MSVKPIKAPASGGGEFEIAPEGVFLARCYKMVDIGTQTTTGMYGTKEDRMVYLFWELLETADGEKIRMNDGEQPYSIFNSYKLSMHPKANLRKSLDSWRGKKFTEEEAADFDITKLLDKFCLLQITHSQSKDGQKTYANVDGIMNTKKTAEGVNEIVGFSISDPDMTVFNDLPEWIQKKIQDAPEWQVTETEQVKSEEPEEKNTIDTSEVPF